VTLAVHLFSGVCGRAGACEGSDGKGGKCIRTWVRTQIVGIAASLTNVTNVTLEWSLACLHLSVKVAQSFLQ
jgi:hypothetical protein